MIVIYVLETCPYCNNALSILNENKIKYNKIIVENTEKEKAHYKKQSKMNTFPQVFLQVNKDNYMKIGGSEELNDLVNYSKSIKSSGISLDALVLIYKLMYKK